MALKTLTANATASLSANGTSTATGSISWAVPSFPEDVTSWDSITISGTWSWGGKGNVNRVTINGTNTSATVPFNITLSRTQTSPLSITCVGGNKNATGSNFTWSNLQVTYTYTVASVTYTVSCIVEGAGGYLLANSYIVESGDYVTVTPRGLSGKELFIKEWYLNGIRLSGMEGEELRGDLYGYGLEYQVTLDTTFKMVTLEIVYEDDYDCLVTEENKTITISALKKTYKISYTTTLSNTADISTLCLVNGNSTAGNLYTFGGTSDYTITYDGNTIYTGRIEIDEVILYNVSARIEGEYGTISISKSQAEYGELITLSVGPALSLPYGYVIYNSTLNGSVLPILLGVEVDMSSFNIKVAIYLDTEIVLYTREITRTYEYDCLVSTFGNTITIRAVEDTYVNSLTSTLYQTRDISSQCLVNGKATTGNTYTFELTSSYTITYNNKTLYKGHVEVIPEEEQYSLYFKGEYGWHEVTKAFKKEITQWRNWEDLSSLFVSTTKIRKLT